MVNQANPFQQFAYITSAHNLKQLVPDTGSEVAFAGRSNAGKSSAINALVSQRALARTSNTPGRTQQIVFFGQDEKPYRFADLPGYGYAKVPKKLRQHWEHTLGRYLQSRDSLKGLILVSDIRHALKDSDRAMLNWAADSQIPAHVLLTKADKVSKNKAIQTHRKIQTELVSYGQTCQIFSVLKKIGVDEARKQVSEWLEVF